MVHPLLVLLLLFVGTPLVELYLMIEVGARIGALPTVALVVLTAVIGGLLVRAQGFAVVLRVREMLERDEMPAVALLEGAVLLIAGASLLLPGFVTDALGFLLLVPPVRQRLVLHWLESRHWIVQVSAKDSQGPRPPGHRLIDGDCTREDR